MCDKPTQVLKARSLVPKRGISSTLTLNLQKADLMMIPLGIADIYQAWSRFKFEDLLDWTSNVLEHAQIMVQQTSKFLLIFAIEERSLRYCLLLPVITPATPNHPRSNANLSQFAPRHSFMQTT